MRSQVRLPVRKGSALFAAALTLVMTAGVASSALAQPPPVTAQGFADAAAGAGQYEIRAAQTAMAQSQSPAVRAFAQEMIDAHRLMAANLRDAATRSGLRPPSESVGADQAMLLSALQSLRGADFDRAYARQQVLVHRAALATEGGYARDGGDPNLKAVATADLPMIQHHLAKAEALLPTR